MSDFFLDLIEIVFSPSTLVFLIPITAIVGSIYASLKKAELKAKAEAGLNAEEKKMFLQLLQNNKEVNERLSNLESIITSLDKDLLALRPKNDHEENKQKVKEISERLKD